MTHVLDNPAWNALISGNKHFSEGNEQVKYFDKEVSPFVGLEENSPGNFEVLYELIQRNSPILLVTPTEIAIPAPWKVINFIRGRQMVYDGGEVPFLTNTEIVPLKDEHIPQMLALTKLTNPGPFAERTIDFGHYHGFLENGRLVAMAGQRLYPFNYAELSAVCTHPDHRGRGYARQLLLHQIQRIHAASNIPFLHVRSNNERAIKVYENLGFSTRKEVYFYVMVKNEINS